MLRLVAFCLAGLLLLLANLAIAQSASLEQCQYLQEQIDYYTKVRRSGGSALQMERWRQQRAEYEDEFRVNRCLKYGKRLRDSR